jgi:hypothetical protein
MDGKGACMYGLLSVYKVNEAFAKVVCGCVLCVKWHFVFCGSTELELLPEEGRYPKSNDPIQQGSHIELSRS